MHAERVGRPTILMATSTYPRWPGDAQASFVHDLAARLTDDARVKILAPHSRGARLREVVDGVEVRRVRYWRDRPDLLLDGPALPTLRSQPSSVLQVPTWLAALGLALRRELATGDVDVVHAHWVLPQGALAHLARRGTNTRLVTTAHGSDIYGVDFLRRFTRWSLQRTDAFIGVSRAVVERARELGLPESTETHVQPMGVDTSIFRPRPKDRDEVRARLGVDGPVVLSVGRLSPEKQVDVLVDIAPALLASQPDAVFVIAGTGLQEADLRRQAQRLQIGDRVRFIGHVDQEHLADWYLAADVLVGTSVFEGFGLVFAEARACGCPVVAFDVAGLRDIVDRPEAGQLVTPNDGAALRAGIEAVLRDRSASRGSATTAAEEAMRRWGWQAVADAHRRILLPDLTPRSG